MKGKIRVAERLKVIGEHLHCQRTITSVGEVQGEVPHTVQRLSSLQRLLAVKTAGVEKVPWSLVTLLSGHL